MIKCWAKLMMMIFVALSVFFREDGPFSVSSMCSSLSPWAKQVADWDSPSPSSNRPIFGDRNRLGILGSWYCFCHHCCCYFSCSYRYYIMIVTTNTIVVNIITSITSVTSVTSVATITIVLILLLVLPYITTIYYYYLLFIILTYSYYPCVTWGRDLYAPVGYSCDSVRGRRSSGEWLWASHFATGGPAVLSSAIVRGVAKWLSGPLSMLISACRPGWDCRWLCHYADIGGYSDKRWDFWISYVRTNPQGFCPKGLEADQAYHKMVQWCAVSLPGSLSRPPETAKIHKVISFDSFSPSSTWTRPKLLDPLGKDLQVKKFLDNLRVIPGRRSTGQRVSLSFFNGNPPRNLGCK